MRALRRAGEPGSEAEQAHQVAGAIDEVAARLGNTRTVARASYVHPIVIEGWREGTLPAGRVRAPETPATPAEERALLRLLREDGVRSTPRAAGVRRARAAARR
jgi:DNA topoisomerase IB